MKTLTGFSIDEIAARAGPEPDVLRLENLDTDLRPPGVAIEATRRALDSDDANSYLPFEGQHALREAAAAHVSRLSGRSGTAAYRPGEECVITAGGTEGMLNTLLALLDPGDEVVLTDPTYAGMIQRVRLAGAVPRLVPFEVDSGAWRLDVDALADAVGARTRAMFLMNPSMPSGAVLDDEAWDAVERLTAAHDLWLIYNAAMERILFDGLAYRHPASRAGLADRTITIGSVSKEFRMIGWRVGWVVGPARAVTEIRRVGIYNVVTPVGIAQPGAVAALTDRDGDAGVARAVAEWARRRDTVTDELAGHGIVPAAGGWSTLLDVRPFGLNGIQASERLLERSRIAATHMTHWGERDAAHLVRLVFSNEPAERLRGLGERVERALR